MYSTPSTPGSWSFSPGIYDNRYYEKLIRIGTAHVRHNVDAHYMNRAINLVKNACIGILQRLDEDKKTVTDKIISVGKILDISLDVITTAYIEEEITDLFSGLQGQEQPDHLLRAFLPDHEPPARPGAHRSHARRGLALRPGRDASC